MIDKARLAATKKQSRSTDVETYPSSPLTGTQQFVASSHLTRDDYQNNQSLLTGTLTTQSPLTGTGAIRIPPVGTGNFQGNSPVGVGSVYDIHASNIDINAQESYVPPTDDFPMSKIYKSCTEIHYYKLDDGNNHRDHPKY
jgi:hypothetical protein